MSVKRQIATARYEKSPRTKLPFNLHDGEDDDPLRLKMSMYAPRSALSRCRAQNWDDDDEAKDLTTPLSQISYDRQVEYTKDFN